MSTSDPRSIFRRMPVEQDHMDQIEEESGAGHSAKSLGLWQLTAIGIGGIIGVGIFSLAGLVAHGARTTPALGPRSCPFSSPCGVRRRRAVLTPSSPG